MYIIVVVEHVVCSRLILIFLLLACYSKSNLSAICKDLIMYNLHLYTFYTFKYLCKKYCTAQCECIIQGKTVSCEMLICFDWMWVCNWLWIRFKSPRYPGPVIQNLHHPRVLWSDCSQYESVQNECIHTIKYFVCTHVFFGVNMFLNHIWSSGLLRSCWKGTPHIKLLVEIYTSPLKWSTKKQRFFILFQC